MVWGRVGSRLWLVCLVSFGCLAQPEGLVAPRWTEIPLGPVPLSRHVWLTLPARVPLATSNASAGLGLPPAAVSQAWRQAGAPEGWSWRRARPELNIRSRLGFTSLRLQGDSVKLRVESRDHSLQWQVQMSTEQVQMEYRWRF